MIRILRSTMLSAMLAAAPLSAFAEEPAAPVAAEAPAAEAATPAPAEPAAPAEDVAPAVEEAAPAAEEAAAPAPTATASAGTLAAPPAGKGQVVFFRPGRMVGAALSFTIREGETPLTKLGNGRYFIHVADPGPHAFEVKSEVTDTINMEIDEGETYYVQNSIGIGVVMGRPNLTPTDQGTFEKFQKSLKPAKPLKPDAK